MYPKKIFIKMRAMLRVRKMSGRTIFLKYCEDAKREGRNFLLESEAREVCQAYGISVPDGGFVKTKEEALDLANKIGYPVVLKIVSPQVLHKSDVGGVKVGISNDEELSKSFDEIVSKVKENVSEAKIRGLLVSKMAEKGVETIIGMKKDRIFGPVVMFGIGGIFVEVYKDVSFRVCPISDVDAEEMIREIKGSKLLEGYRGLPKANLEALKDVLKKTCLLASENPEIDSIDLNPTVVNEKGALALDTRIIIS